MIQIFQNIYTYYPGLTNYYFIICFLVALLNQYYCNSLKGSKAKLAELTLTSFVFLIPIHEWYNVAYHGAYFLPKVFIKELIGGIILFILFEILGKINIIQKVIHWLKWPIIITILILLYKIYEIIEIIKMAP